MRFACGLLLSAGLCAMSLGCAENTPAPGKVETVSPAIPAKATPPADKADEKPTPPPDAGSTTGGGTETPAEPKDGE